MLTLKRKALTYTKNLFGTRITPKVVMFVIDDYGNIHLHSKAARENLASKGVPVDQTRFSMYDSLETAEDLEMLFNVLASVKDVNGNHAIFTPFALPANIDFDRVNAEEGKYHYELLPTTFDKLPSHQNAWQLWQEGMRAGIFMPQFHGREHLNVKLFEDLLKIKHPHILANLEERSYAGIHHDINNVGFTEAFSFDQKDEVLDQKEILADGLRLFEQVFGYPAIHFNAPGAREHIDLHEVSSLSGIKLVDTDVVKNEHQGNQTFKKSFNPMGSKNKYGQTQIFRNVVFEPTLDEHNDWVSKCMVEIEIAFRCHKPAIISSHRVNFCGHIDPSIRKKSLGELGRLLYKMINKWPDIEFKSSKGLFKIILDEN